MYVTRALTILWCTSTCISFNPVPPDSWPDNRLRFGYLSGVTVDSSGFIYVFERGNRAWGPKTFNQFNEFSDKSLGPIPEPTIKVLNNQGTLLLSTGENMFYLPHGITVDDERNLWVTDVALHQVFKFPPLDLTKNRKLGVAILTLGEPLRPGHDTQHFCKPTSVAIAPVSGDFFVADGYCNARIMKFDHKGKFLMQWGKPTRSGYTFSLPGIYDLFVPHSVTIDSLRNELIVADRENSRLMWYDFSGKFHYQSKTHGNPYGVAFSTVHDGIFAVTGSMLKTPSYGVFNSLRNKSIAWTFAPPEKFKTVHDVAVSPDGKYVYAVELEPHSLWRFSVGEFVNDNASSVVEMGKEFASASIGLPSEDETPSTNSKTPLSVRNDATFAYLGANQIALSVVTGVVLFSILLVSVHIYKKKRWRKPMEERGLILADDDE